MVDAVAPYVPFLCALAVLLVREIMHHRETMALLELVNRVRVPDAARFLPPPLVRPAEPDDEAPRVVSGSDEAEWRRERERRNAAGI
jgi:hypothetical protein